MKQTSLIGLLLAIAVLLLLSLAANGLLWQTRQQLAETAAAEATNAAAAQATLVQVMAERHTAQPTPTATAADTAAQQATQVAVIDALKSEVAALQTAVAQAATPARPPSNSLPQVRLFLVNPNTTVSRVGEPIGIIVSAGHGAGIAAVNVQVDGQSLLSESPLDPYLYTTTTYWTPSEVGDYRITAIATSIEGRTSNPATLTLTIVDSEDLSSDILRRIERNVVELRGLSPPAAVSSFQLTTDQLRQQIEANFFDAASRDKTRRDLLALSAFDLVSADYDPFEFLISFYTQAVAGYYEPDTNTLYVLNDDQKLDTEEQLTHAHEYMHALQDEHFSLGLLGDETDLLSSDAQLAVRALGEGEAELIELLYEQRGFLSGENLGAEAARIPTEFADTPDFILSDFTFPYIKGSEFVYRLYNEGGFSAIDAAWANLPQSTEQILHPERYSAGDGPQIITLPSLETVLGQGWALLKTDVLGEFYLREYLELWLEREVVDTAATGWGGDRYAVYLNEESRSVVLVMRLAWDTAADHTEFDSAYAEFAAARASSANATAVENGQCWPTPQNTLCLFTLAEDSLIIRAPDTALVAALAAPIIEGTTP